MKKIFTMERLCSVQKRRLFCLLPVLATTLKELKTRSSTPGHDRLKSEKMTDIHCVDDVVISLFRVTLEPLNEAWPLRNGNLCNLHPNSNLNKNDKRLWHELKSRLRCSILSLLSPLL